MSGFVASWVFYVGTLSDHLIAWFFWLESPFMYVLNEPVKIVEGVLCLIAVFTITFHMMGTCSFRIE
jgi:hypothetical protein